METSAQDLQTLTRRLDRLERQNRWLLRTLAGMLILAGTGVLLGAQRQAEKTADLSNVFLRDNSGKRCGWMRVTQNGLALVFADGEGQFFSGLDLGRDGAAFRYFRPDGTPHCGLSVERNGVAVAYQEQSGNVVTGNNAIKNDLGNAIRNRPYFAKPQAKSTQ
jgi:hypothetical protein